MPASQEPERATSQPAPASAASDEDERRPRRPLPLAVAVAMRPWQWVKNLFVAAPLVFSKSLLDARPFLRAAAAVGVFCLISSAVYLWNDLIDVEKDRTHPKKRRRPIASGDLPVPAARALAATAAALGLALGYLLAPGYGAAVFGYLAINFAYSLVLKRVPYVDVACIAAGFLLRVLGGALAIDVHASPYLLLCTGLVACFNGLGKRAHELASAGEKARSQRDVLAAYHPGPLRAALYSTGLATIGAYVAYTRAEHTRTFFHTDRMIWTLPLVVLGIGRFLMLVTRREKSESPTEAMLRDPLFVATLAVYGVMVVAIIYSAR